MAFLSTSTQERPTEKRKPNFLASYMLNTKNELYPKYQLPEDQEPEKQQPEGEEEQPEEGG